MGSDSQIVEVRGQTGLVLEPAPGEASFNLLEMAREGLLFGLRAALQTARKSRTPVRRSGLQVKSGPRWIPVTLDVIPLTSAGRLHFLVLFKTPEEGQAEAPPPAVTRRERRGTVELLRRELAASREYLQSIIQELEASNEELQSANEEILSSNEGSYWDVAALHDLLAADVGAVTRQTIAADTDGEPWIVQAGVLASHDDPGRRQLLLVARHEG